MPAVDTIFTIAPGGRPAFACSRIAGVAAASRRCAPVRLVRITASHAAWSDLKMNASRMMAALLTTMSTAPKRSRAVATARAAVPSSAMSPHTAAHPSRPAATFSASDGSSGSPEIETPESTMTTRAPSAARSSAIASPMPRAAPLTIATRWSRFISGLIIEGVGMNLPRAEAPCAQQRARRLDHDGRPREVSHRLLWQRQIDRLVYQAVAPAARTDLLGKDDLIVEVRVLRRKVPKQSLMVDVALAAHAEVE